MSTLLQVENYSNNLFMMAGVSNDNAVYRAKPCPVCARLIIQAGIKNVYVRIGENAEEYDVVSAKDLVWHL